LQVYWRLCNW